MKPPQSLLAKVSLVLFAVGFSVLLFGCGGRMHSYSTSTTPEGVQTVSYESNIRLVGQKLDVSELAVTDAVNTNGWSYGVQAASVSVEPKSVIIESLEKIAVAVAPAAIDAAMKYFTGAGSASNSPDPPATPASSGVNLSEEEVLTVRALLDEINASREPAE